MRPIVVFLILASSWLARWSAATADPARCVNEIACARACGAAAPAACERLAELVENELIDTQFAPDHRPDGFRVRAFTYARANLAAACATQPRACVLLARLEVLGLGGPAEPVAGEQRLRAACDGGEPRGCTAVGMVLEKRGYWERTHSVFDDLRRACDGGHRAGCAWLHAFEMREARLRYGADPELFPDAPTRIADGVARLRALCAAGEAEGCAMAGAMLERGMPGLLAADPAAAQTLRGQACTAGSAVQCFTLGSAPGAPATWLEQGCALGAYWACDKLADRVSAAGDVPGARAARERACRAGSPATCEDLAAEADAVAARADWLERACEAGADPACVERELLRIARDRGAGNRARAALGRYCDDRNGAACEAVGVIYQEGRHVRADLGRARTYFERACATDRAWFAAHAASGYTANDGCLRLDGMACDAGDLAACQRWGLGAITLDPPGALAALDRACTPTNAHACALAALRRLDGRVAGAEDALERACAAGSSYGCHEGARRLPDRDRQRGYPMLIGACQLGEPADCVALAKLRVAAAPPDLDGAVLAAARGCDSDRDGRDVACAERDRLRALQRVGTLAQACDRDDGAACLEVGDLAASTDPRLALRAWTVACRQRLAPGCRRAAEVYDGQRGAAAVDVDAARAAYQAACELGDPSACAPAGVKWAAVGDDARARAAFTRGCDGDVLEGCRQLVALARGAGDRAALITVLRRGCALGDAMMCAEANPPRRPGAVSRTVDRLARLVGALGRPLAAVASAADWSAGAYRLRPDAAAADATSGPMLGATLARRDHGLVRPYRTLASASGTLGYDTTAARFDHDIGADVGVAIASVELTLRLGHQALGDDAPGLPAAWYLGWDLHAGVALSPRTRVTAGYGRRWRDAQPDADVIDLRLDWRWRRQRVAGLGWRRTSLAGGVVDALYVQLTR